MSCLDGWFEPGVRFAAVMACAIACGLSACSEEQRMVVHLGEPISATVAASPGFEPVWVDGLDDGPYTHPRGLKYVEAVELHALGEGKTAFRYSGQLRVGLDMNHGVLDSVDVQTIGGYVPLAEAPALVERLYGEVRAQGWVDQPGWVYRGIPPEVWERCVQPATVRDEGLDAAGVAPRSARLGLFHPRTGLYLGVTVNCVQSPGGGPWMAKGRFLVTFGHGLLTGAIKGAHAAERELRAKAAAEDGQP